MKLTALIIMCASVILLLFYTEALRKRSIEYIMTVSDFFAEFASLASLMEGDAAVCIRRLSEMPEFSRLKFLSVISREYTEGCNFREIWTYAMNESCDFLFFNKEVKTLLLSFADSFGKSGFADFTDKCRCYSERAAGIYGREKLKWEKNRALQSGLGVFAVTLIFIIFV